MNILSKKDLLEIGLDPTNSNDVKSVANSNFKECSYFGGIINTSFEELKQLFVKQFGKNYSTKDTNIDGVINEICKWLLQDKTCKLPLNKGFILCGKPGVGKTQIMKCLNEIFNEYDFLSGRYEFNKNGDPCGNTTGLRKRMYLSKMYTEYELRYSDEKLFQAKNYPGFIIDDICFGGNSDFKVYGNVRNIFEEVVFDRYSNDLFLFGTVNDIDLKNSAILDRVYDMTSFVTVNGMTRNERNKMLEL